MPHAVVLDESRVRRERKQRALVALAVGAIAQAPHRERGLVERRKHRWRDICSEPGVDQRRQTEVAVVSDAVAGLA